MGGLGRQHPPVLLVHEVGVAALLLGRAVVEVLVGALQEALPGGAPPALHRWPLLRLPFLRMRRLLAAPTRCV